MTQDNYASQLESFFKDYHSLHRDTKDKYYKKLDFFLIN